MWVCESLNSRPMCVHAWVELYMCVWLRVTGSHSSVLYQNEMSCPGNSTRPSSRSCCHGAPGDRSLSQSQVRGILTAHSDERPYCSGPTDSSWGDTDGEWIFRRNDDPLFDLWNCLRFWSPMRVHLSVVCDVKYLRLKKSALSPNTHIYTSAPRGPM